MRYHYKGLDITVNRIHRIECDGALKGFVDICINDAILIKGIRLIQGRAGMFISMPSERAKDAKWYESVRCLNAEIRETLTEVILKAYAYETGGQQDTQGHGTHDRATREYRAAEVKPAQPTWHNPKSARRRT